VTPEQAQIQRTLTKHWAIDRRHTSGYQDPAFRAGLSGRVNFDASCRIGATECPIWRQLADLSNVEFHLQCYCTEDGIIGFAQLLSLRRCSWASLFQTVQVSAN
jgi:hypothetical protein